MNRLIGLALLLCGLIGAIGPFVWVHTLTPFTIGEVVAWDREGAPAAPRTVEIGRGMAPVAIDVTVTADAARERAPIALAIRTGGAEMFRRSVEIPLSPGGGGAEGTARLARVLSPTYGAWEIAATPGAPADGLRRIVVHLEGRVATLDWAIVAGGALVAFIGVMGLRRRKAAAVEGADAGA